jgi:hypothetical protein
LHPCIDYRGLNNITVKDHYHSSPRPSSHSRGPPCSPSWTYGTPTTWCRYGKGMSQRSLPVSGHAIWPYHYCAPGSG